jgi:hypothetical protein
VDIGMTRQQGDHVVQDLAEPAPAKLEIFGGRLMDRLEERSAFHDRRERPGHKGEIELKALLSEIGDLRFHDLTGLRPSSGDMRQGEISSRKLRPQAIDSVEDIDRLVDVSGRRDNLHSVIGLADIAKAG